MLLCPLQLIFRDCNPSTHLRLPHVPLQREVTANLKLTKFPDQGQYAAAVVNSLVGRMRAPDLVDRIINLFHSLSLMVTTSTNARAEESVGADDNSVMGFYLRRCWCDLTSLPFEAVCTLADACEVYMAAAEDPDAAKRPGPPSSTFRPRISTDRFLAQRSTAIAVQESETPPAKLAQPLDQLEKAAPGIPSVHLGQLAKSLADLDVSASVARLHGFSDTSPDPFVPGIGAVACGDAPLQPRSYIRLQYAALNLSATHARLGQIKAAMLALGEAMLSAQQAADNTCLVHALAVLCQIMEGATPGSMELQGQPMPGTSPAESHIAELGTLLRRCLHRAEELGMPHLSGYARLALARHAMLHPSAPPRDEGLGSQEIAAGARPGFAPAPPSAAASELAAAVRYLDHMSLAASLAAAVPMPPPSSSGMASLRILKGLWELFSATPATFGPGMMGSQLSGAAEVLRQARAASLLRGAGWQVFGSRRLAQAHAAAYLESGREGATATDTSTALAQLVISVAERHGFEAADSVLEAAKGRFKSSAQGVPLHAASLAMAHLRAMHNGAVHAALSVASKMIALASPDDSTSIGFRIDGEEAAARALLAGGHYAQAEKAARTVFAIADGACFPVAALRALVLLARIHYESGSWATALPYATSALQQYRGMHADMLGAEAALVMAGIWRRMGSEHLPKAREEIEAMLPLVLAHGGLDLRGRVRVALVEVGMEEARSKADVAAQSEELLGLLQEALVDFVKLEDWRQAAHAHHLRALIYDAVGDGANREKAAKQSIMLKKERASSYGSYGDMVS